MKPSPTIHSLSACLVAVLFLFADNLGAAPVQLTSSSTTDIHPRWHPNGNTIAFMKQISGEYQPATVNAAGGGEAMLANNVNVPANHSAISWLGNSPTLLVAETKFVHELFAFNTGLAPFTRTATDGNDSAFTRKLQVLGGRNSSAFVSSRDGQVVAWRDSTNNNTFTAIRAASFASLNDQYTHLHGVLVLSAASPSPGARGMALTPNGGQLVISLPSGTGNDLFVYNTSGVGTPLQLTFDGASSGMFNFSPDVSPDGTKVLYQRGTAVAGSTDIYMVSISGGGQVQITSTPTIDEAAPSFGPDGYQYAYQRLDSSWNIWKDTLTLAEIGVQQPLGTDLVDGSATVNFGITNLNATGASKTFTITNSGNTTMTGLAVTKDGSHAADFTVGALGATTLAANGSTTFTVSFSPSAAGTRTAAIHIASNDSDENPFDITVTGTGNTLPVAQNAAYTRSQGLAFKIKIADLLAASTSDADGNPRTLQSVGTSAQGATLTTNSTHIFYTPANNNNDSFTYTVSDGQGGTATATITVTVTIPTGVIQTITSSGGDVTIAFAGVPGYEYDIERASNVNGPWTVVSTQTTPANGLFTYTETPPTSPSFYRLVQN